jgi:hypothetical protein
MRKLHPVGPHEVLVAQGQVRRPDGVLEAWSHHHLPGDRLVVRVEASTGELWHLTLDEHARPERMEVRLVAGGRQIEATYTFFEDEVLVWRRGAEPASEALAVPPGYRLLWPPVAGRGACLAGAVTPGQVEAVLCLSLVRRGLDRGGLVARPVKFTVTMAGNTLTLRTPGLPDMAADLAADGTLLRWQEGDAVWTELGTAD